MRLLEHERSVSWPGSRRAGPSRPGTWTPGSAGGRRTAHDDDFASVDYDLDQITENVVNNGFVHAYVDLSDNAESWFPLPQVYGFESGAIAVVDFGYSTGRLALFFTSHHAGALLGTVRLYEGRYKLKLIIGAQPSSGGSTNDLQVAVGDPPT